MVGESLVKMVRKGFDSGHVEKFLNKTLIVLIPKVPDPEVVSQFWHINLCSIPYNLLTKVLMNHLKPLMPKLVARNQTNFFGGHNIMGNVIIAKK